MTDDPQQPAIRYIDGRRMQCKDISDVAFLDAVHRTPGSPLSRARHSWHVWQQLETVIGRVPHNLFFAKARKLIAAGKIEGCGCGCSGGFTVVEGQAEPVGGAGRAG